MRAIRPIRCFVVAASTIRDLLADLRARNVTILFARVSPYLRADMNRHGITAAAGAEHVFRTLHEALATARAVLAPQPLDRPITQPAGPPQA